jgi:RNase P subunit RPR2
MSNHTDYRQRAVDERAKALQSELREVAAIHEELARQYQALVDKVELRPKLRIARTTAR